MIDTDKLVTELQKRSKRCSELAAKYKEHGDLVKVMEYIAQNLVYKELLIDIMKGKFNSK